ncbi:hypothetical protein [Spirosoma spitsbergense]|uniref:hypothetical protein n=1 Tax=Spirosoma spitsbergense TaxID=431554 RepID=UPI00038106DE|nr:hypothetical protein [Spirosoma spitsbergense]
MLKKLLKIVLGFFALPVVTAGGFILFGVEHERRYEPVFCCFGYLSYGERVLAGLVESTINQVIGEQFVKHPRPRGSRCNRVKAVVAGLY